MTDLHHAVVEALASGQFDLNDEKDCQAQMHDWLVARLPGRAIQREHRLSAGDIPDFYVEGIVIEVKMNSARPADILRQLARYAEHDEVAAIVLVSNRAVRFGPTVCGKPLAVLHLGRAWL